VQCSPCWLLWQTPNRPGETLLLLHTPYTVGRITTGSLWVHQSQLHQMHSEYRTRGSLQSLLSSCSDDCHCRYIQNTCHLGLLTWANYSYTEHHSSLRIDDTCINLFMQILQNHPVRRVLGQSRTHRTSAPGQTNGLDRQTDQDVVPAPRVEVGVTPMRQWEPFVGPMRWFSSVRCGISSHPELGLWVRKFPENFRKCFPPVQKFPTGTNLPNNCIFAYIFTFYRLLQHLWSLVVH